MRDLITDLLAGYRLTRVVLEDSKEFPPLMGARTRLAKRLDEHPPWNQALECAWCSSAWVAVGVVAARRLAPQVWSPVAAALAISAAAGLLRQAEERIG